VRERELYVAAGFTPPTALAYCKETPAKRCTPTADRLHSRRKGERTSSGGGRPSRRIWLLAQPRLCDGAS